MMITFPLWFKIFLGWFLFTMILGVVNYFARDKYAHKLMGLPTEKKTRFLKSCVLRIKIYKMFFLASPLYLIVIPFLIYKYNRQDFFHMTVLQILLYIGIVKDFLYRKFLIKKIKWD